MTHIRYRVLRSLLNKGAYPFEKTEYNDVDLIPGGVYFSVASAANAFVNKNIESISALEHRVRVLKAENRYVMEAVANPCKEQPE